MGNISIVADIQNIACQTRFYDNHGANEITPGSYVIENNTTSERPLNGSQKRKIHSFGRTVIGKMSITELNFMVDRNKHHMQFLSECGKLARNRESVIKEEIKTLTAIIQHKQSSNSRSCVHDNDVNIPENSDIVSKNNYN